MAAEEETFDQIPSGEELFEGATPEAPKEEPKAEETQPETEEAKEARERDEKGRFKAKEETPEPEQPEAEAEQPEPEEKQDHRVPLMELLNEREKRQEEQRQREAIQQQLWQLQQQLQQREQPKPEPIDPFQDPEGWAQSQSQTFEQKMRAMEGNFSLRLAKAVHKEAFDEAWGEMISRSQTGDDSMRQQVLNSSDPGETLVNLYRQAKTFKEVNGDPNAWLEAKKAEWLSDPQVQAQILAAAKETATQSQKPNVKLPPSMNKAGSSGASRGSGDMSDAALWEHTQG